MNKCVAYINKLKPEYIFLVLGTFFGLLFMLITPIFQVADEPMHLLRACEVSNLVLHNDKNGNYQKDFLPNKELVKKNSLIFTEFKDINHYTQLFEFNDLNYTHNNSGYSFIMYLPSAIGLKISSLFTQNPYIQFFTARFFNLFSWLALTYFAIRITPFKWQFLVCALFPMTIYEGMSVSADSLNLGFAFFYIAYIFNLAYKKENITNKNIVIYFILTFLTIFFKGLFIFSFLLLLIPKNKFKYKYVLFSLQTIFGLLLSAIISSNSFILIGDGIDVNARKAMLLAHPMYVIKLFINTFLHKTLFYFQSSLFRLGWLEIEPKPIPVILLYIAYLVSALLSGIKTRLSDKFIVLTINAAFILCTTLLYYLTFSPLDDGIIIGTQGRYFIPLHLTFATILTGFIHLNEIKKSITKTFILSIIIYNLVYATILLITFFRT